MTSDAGAGWALATVMVPLLGAAAAFMLQRWARAIGLGATILSAAAALGLIGVLAGGAGIHQAIGGWSAPLGIELKADGMSGLMLGMTALVGLAVVVQAARTLPSSVDAGTRWAFWPLWLLLLGGMNALYLSGDQFNLYVTLEIVSLSAVALTALSGKPAAFKAAMRYLLVGLFASLLYLLGVALLYAAYGVLDLAGAARLLRDEPFAQLAMALMFAALALKTALFPLHFWLPSAHGNASAPVSALLSGLVVKTSFYLVARLWFDVFVPAGLASEAAGLALGTLGAGAIIWGSVQALLAERLKLLVAYSTVSQIGYLFLLFPLSSGKGDAAWQGVILLALAHAVAKASMFLSCELVAGRIGHDRVRDLTSSPRLPRVTQISLALAAVSLIGLPPSGGFSAKWLLLTASLRDGFSIWTAVITLGTLLSAAAMMRFLVRFFSGEKPVHGGANPALAARSLDLVPFALAVCAILLGLAAPELLHLLAVGANG